MRSVLRFNIAEKSPVQSRFLGSTNRWLVKLCAGAGETDPIAKAKRVRRVAIRIRIDRALEKKLLAFVSNRCCSNVQARAARCRYLSVLSRAQVCSRTSGRACHTGIKSKRRMRPDGAEYGGQTLSRVALYLILQNRLYRGEIPHKDNSYPGEHPTIVDKPLWDEVQAVLAANRVDRATGARARHPSLLTGMVFDETGERLTPTYAVKKGTRYRYYVSTSLITGAGRNRARGRRIPAGNWKAW
jgi:hypothetical protein